MISSGHMICSPHGFTNFQSRILNFLDLLDQLNLVLIVCLLLVFLIQTSRTCSDWFIFHENLGLETRETMWGADHMCLKIMFQVIEKRQEINSFLEVCQSIEFVKIMKFHSNGSQRI